MGNLAAENVSEGPKGPAAPTRRPERAGGSTSQQGGGADKAPPFLVSALVFSPLAARMPPIRSRRHATELPETVPTPHRGGRGPVDPWRACWLWHDEFHRGWQQRQWPCSGHRHEHGRALERRKQTQRISRLHEEAWSERSSHARWLGLGARLTMRICV